MEVKQQILFLKTFKKIIQIKIERIEISDMLSVMKKIKIPHIVKLSHMDLSVITIPVNVTLK